MTMSNSQRVGDALQLLTKGLAPFVERELRQAYGDQWPSRAVEELGLAPAEVNTVSLAAAAFLPKGMRRLWYVVFGRCPGQSSEPGLAAPSQTTLEV